MATLKSDWEMPKKPFDICEICGGTDIYPQATCEDGWELFWGCDLCGQDGLSNVTVGEMDTLYIDWPFGDDDNCNAADLQALGFEIV